MYAAQVPFRWLQTLDEIHKLSETSGTRAVLSFAQVEAIALTNGIRADKVKLMLSVLHDIGEVMGVSSPYHDTAVAL